LRMTTWCSQHRGDLSMVLFSVRIYYFMFGVLFILQDLFNFKGLGDIKLNVMKDIRIRSLMPYCESHILPCHSQPNRQYITMLDTVRLRPIVNWKWHLSFAVIMILFLLISQVKSEKEP
jgi:hypothetical protein